MKKLVFGLVVFCFLALTSCSDNSSTKSVLEAIPEDVDLVAVSDIKTIVESAGGSVESNKVKLPLLLTDLFSEKDEESVAEFNRILKNGGINVDCAALTLNYKDSYPVIVFKLDDPKQFMEFIEKEGFREKNDDNGAVYYSKKTYESDYDSKWDDYSYIAVKNKYAYLITDVWVGSSFKPMRKLEGMIEGAAEKSFKDHPLCKYVTQGNALGASFRLPSELRSEMLKAGVPSQIVSIYDGYVGLQANLENDKAVLTVKLFDEDGKPTNVGELSDMFNLSGKISGKALSFLNKNENLVLAFDLEDVDWDSYIEMVGNAMNMSRSQRGGLYMAKAYLNRINGTIALGLGITNGLESIYSLDRGKDFDKNLSATMVVETVDGKAEGLMKELKGFISTIGANYEETSNGFYLEEAGVGAFYGEAVDNFIVLSTSKIDKQNNNPTVKAVDFTKYIGGIGVKIDEKNQLEKDLNIKSDICLSIVGDAQNCESIMSLQIKGGKQEGILAKILRLGIDLSGKIKEIEEERNDYYRQSSYYDFSEDYDRLEESDYEVVEEVVEDVDSVAVCVE